MDPHRELNRTVMNTWLVTGGAGFIGSNFVVRTCAEKLAQVVNIDKLTYAGHLENLDRIKGDDQHVFLRGDILDRGKLAQIISQYKPQAVIHFAAESHVDRSIHNPADFLTTNVLGTAALLDAALTYWRTLEQSEAKKFRFMQISTDEVFGSLRRDEAPFTENNAFTPNSPYAASKAAADHLVRAYHVTYGLPTLTTHCSNNYGPYQYPEKLVPLMILNARKRLPLPIYGDGQQIRDWLHVDDHCAALLAVLEGGEPGAVYNIGGDHECTNRDLVTQICLILDDMYPDGKPHSRLITSVVDRPGHDRRYAIDASKIKRELQWRPKISLNEGIRRTVAWYAEREDWVEAVCRAEHEKWLTTQYADHRDPQGKQELAGGGSS